MLQHLYKGLIDKLINFVFASYHNTPLLYFIKKLVLLIEYLEKIIFKTKQSWLKFQYMF